jgi:hypothetical protein
MWRPGRRSAVLVGACALLTSRRGLAGADDLRAPFGLTWGVASDEVRKTGVDLTADPSAKDFGVSFMATNLGKVLSDTEGVLLSFGFNDKLWRIATFGRTLGPDPSGSQVVARYLDLAVSLAEKYGKGVETDRRDTEMFKNADQYVASLEQGRAYRYTSYRTNSVSVELSIRAKDMESAYYLILFEYLPGAGQFQMDKKTHEKDAL